MIRTAFNSFKLSQRAYCFSTMSEGAAFLQMVEQYFDKAGALTNIRPDKLNFYKKADNVVKFNLTLTRGNSILIQTMAQSKLSPLIDANTKHLNSQPRVEQGMLKMLIFTKLKHWPH